MRLVDREQTVITHDSGMPRDQLAPFWETLIPRGYLGWGKSTQLGSWRRRLVSLLTKLALNSRSLLC
jgi:hypothetical protein